MSLLPLAVDLRLYLMKLIPRILMKREDLRRVVDEFGRDRCGVLHLYNDRGEEVRLWVGFDEEGEPNITFEPQSRANNEISMHYNTFKAILEGQLDPRVAYAHDIIEVKSLDGLPISFHAFLWFSWFEAIQKEFQ